VKRERKGVDDTNEEREGWRREREGDREKVASNEDDTKRRPRTKRATAVEKEI